MTYSDFQKECAYYGHIETPLTEKQFNQCVANNLTSEEIYSIGCDVSSGYEFDDVIG